MKNIYGIGCSILYIILVFATSKLLEKKEKEMSRKYIHIMLCNIWFIFMYFFDNFIVAAILPALFVVINSLSYKYDLIKIMEREDKKEGIGTVYYAISLTILSIANIRTCRSTHNGIWRWTSCSHWTEYKKQGI